VTTRIGLSDAESGCCFPERPVLIGPAAPTRRRRALWARHRRAWCEIGKLRATPRIRARSPV